MQQGEESAQRSEEFYEHEEDSSKVLGKGRCLSYSNFHKGHLFPLVLNTLKKIHGPKLAPYSSTRGCFCSYHKLKIVDKCRNPSALSASTNFCSYDPLSYPSSKKHSMLYFCSEERKLQVWRVVLWFNF